MGVRSHTQRESPAAILRRRNRERYSIIKRFPLRRAGEKGRQQQPKKKKKKTAGGEIAATDHIGNNKSRTIEIGRSGANRKTHKK